MAWMANEGYWQRPFESCEGVVPIGDYRVSSLIFLFFLKLRHEPTVFRIRKCAKVTSDWLPVKASLFSGAPVDSDISRTTSESERVDSGAESRYDEGPTRCRQCCLILWTPIAVRQLCQRDW